MLQVLSIVITTTMIALPWLVDLPFLVTWFALLAGLRLASSKGIIGSFWITWLWATGAIALAFFWSPAAMAYSLSSSYWLGLVVSIPLFFWDGLRMGLSFWLGAKLSSSPKWNWATTAACFVVLESTLPSVFPWKLGYTQLHSPWILQGLDIFGPSWSTVVALAGAGLLNELGNWFKERSSGVAPTVDSTKTYPWATIVSCVNLLYCALAIPFWSNYAEEQPCLNIALVQVDPSYQTSLSEMQELTKKVQNQVDLVCWPESSGGTLDLALPHLRDEKTTFAFSKEPARGIRPWPEPTCELLLGGKNYQIDSAGQENLYVSAMLLDQKEAISDRYFKRHLMPFGEYVPLGDWLPSLDALFDMQDKLTRGELPKVMESKTGAKLGTMLCYEDMLSQAATELSRRDANLLISLVNGSSFESTTTLRQHRLLSQARAIENRRYFARCAATGETCIISPCGAVTARLPLMEKGVLTSKVRLIEDKTIYASIPFLLAALASLVIGNALIAIQLTNGRLKIGRGKVRSEARCVLPQVRMARTGSEPAATPENALSSTNR